MGSKRNNSKNLNKAPSSLPPADSPPVENSQNPNKNPSFPSPSKFPKKPKPSAPMSTDSSFASPAPSAVGDAPSQKTNRKRKDSEIPAKASAGGAPIRWTEEDKLRLLRAVDAFRSSNGMLPDASHMHGFVKEMKDYVPFSLSEKTIHKKIRHIHSKFMKCPKPGPESSEVDRSFYELASKVWGSDASKANGSASGAAKVNSMKDKFLKKQKDDKAKVEGEDQGKIEDDVTGEKAKVDMEVVERGEKYEKEDLLDNHEAGCPYKYLKHALEEFWLEKKLDMDTLYTALPKVEPGKAELLDKQLAEIYEEETKFEIEKINLTNEILRVMLDHLVGGRNGA